MWQGRRGGGDGGGGAVQQHDCSLLLQLLLQPIIGVESQDSAHISQVVAAFLYLLKNCCAQ